MSDTIAAIATAPGQGGIAIVRVSGDMAEDILRRIFRPVGGKHPLPTHLLTYGYIVDGTECIDECMAVIMRAPKSYTREDVVEFQLHGGGCVAQKVLSLCLSSGARLAQPGEFTRRAFLSGRIDLSQAEAVMDLIAAQGEQSRKAAMRQLTGGASSFIRKAADELYAIQAGVAACIDYPEEISEEEAASDLAPRIAHLAKTLADACDERAARLLQSGLRVALCGQPNVGKSSLLNALLGEEKAIVTAIPGTTRDLVEGTLMLSGSVIHLTDTAGLHDTDDPVERIGVDRARRALADADVVLLVLDMSRPLSAEDESLLRTLHGRNGCIVLNKSDLPPVLTESKLQDAADGKPILTVSASVPDSLQPLKSYLCVPSRRQRPAHPDPAAPHRSRAPGGCRIASGGGNASQLFGGLGGRGLAAGADGAGGNHGRRGEGKAARRSVRQVLRRKINKMGRHTAKSVPAFSFTSAQSPSGCR